MIAHDLTIRPATTADLPAVTAVYAEAVRLGTATFEIDPPDLADMIRRFQQLSAGGFPYLVAERGGKLAGYAYAGPYHVRPAFRFTVEDSIYVAPHAQSGGVGRGLLDELIKQSEQRGFRQMVAMIGDSANAASIALHRGAGFQTTGTLHDVGHKFGRWLDCVIMQRPLGDGPASAPGD